VIKKDFELGIVAPEGSPPVRHYEMFYDGIYFGKVRTPERFTVSIDGMNDGYHEFRIVGIANTPTANRTSRRLGFVVDRAGMSVSLEATSRKVRRRQQVELKATCSDGGSLELHQNSRVIAKTSSDQSMKVPAAELGLGITQLRAVKVLEDGTLVRSLPLEVEIVP